MKERAVLVLRPSWLTIGGVIALIGIALVMARLWINDSFARNGLSLGVAVMVGIAILVVAKTCPSLRVGTLPLTPEALSVVTGKQVKTAEQDRLFGF